MTLALHRQSRIHDLEWEERWRICFPSLDFSHFEPGKTAILLFLWMVASLPRISTSRKQSVSQSDWRRKRSATEVTSITTSLYLHIRHPLKFWLRMILRRLLRRILRNAKKLWDFLLINLPNMVGKTVQFILNSSFHRSAFPSIQHCNNLIFVHFSATYWLLLHLFVYANPVQDHLLLPSQGEGHRVAAFSVNEVWWINSQNYFEDYDSQAPFA